MDKWRVAILSTFPPKRISKLALVEGSCWLGLECTCPVWFPSFKFERVFFLKELENSQHLACLIKSSFGISIDTSSRPLTNIVCSISINLVALTSPSFHVHLIKYQTKYSFRKPLETARPYDQLFTMSCWQQVIASIVTCFALAYKGKSLSSTNSITVYYNGVAVIADFIFRNGQLFLYISEEKS